MISKKLSSKSTFKASDQLKRPTKIETIKILNHFLLNYFIPRNFSKFSYDRNISLEEGKMNNNLNLPLNYILILSIFKKKILIIK